MGREAKQKARAAGEAIDQKVDEGKNLTPEEREARRAVRRQKVENSKGELKEMGREAKQKAKVAGEAIDQKVDDEKNLTPAERETRRAKVENSKRELKEMGREAKEKAKVAGKAVKREAKKTGEAIDRKVDDQ
jgi:hypothetical protein